ncbi:MAG: DUF3152 domain-containing protein [Candidatus Saccharimonadales bacterium]
MKRLWLAIATILCGGFISASLVYAADNTAECDPTKSPWCVAPRVYDDIGLLSEATVPKLATPSWLAPAPSAARVVTYAVTTRGTVTADLSEFKSVVNATLNDGRGWTRLGVSFREVESGGDFTMFLSEASQMTTFSADGCDSTYSCNVGSAVVINQDRWINGTPSWSGAGGDLASYRQMVINHETGHWLGHGHRYCSAAGQAAPVMQQQSMDMQGCTPNAWPQSGEMYSPKLGIRS